MIKAPKSFLDTPEMERRMGMITEIAAFLAHLPIEHQMTIALGWHDQETIERMHRIIVKPPVNT